MEYYLYFADFYSTNQYPLQSVYLSGVVYSITAKYIVYTLLKLPTLQTHLPDSMVQVTSVLRGRANQVISRSAYNYSKASD